jgi:hypothetical protein
MDSVQDHTGLAQIYYLKKRLLNQTTRQHLKKMKLMRIKILYEGDAGKRRLITLLVQMFLVIKVANLL